MMNMKFGIVACVMLCTGCVQAKAPKQEKTPEPVIDPFQEIKADAVSFVRMHPGAAQKNSYLDFKHFENTQTGQREWRVDNKPISLQNAELLENLLKSVSENLIESDGIYACRYQENMPQYRLKFSADGHEYHIVSSSSCLHGAPYNILVDNKYYIRLDGQIGAMLETLVHESGLALNIGESAGMIMIDTPIVMDSYRGIAQKSPRAHFDELFKKDSKFSEFIGQIEGKFGAIPLPAVACNQAKSEDCTEVSAQYTLKIGQSEFPISLKYANREVSVNGAMPALENLESLKKMTQTSIYKLYEEGEMPVKLSFDAEANCTMVRGLAKFMNAPDMASCAAWRLNKDNMPAVVYYEGLESFWIAAESSEAFYQSLCQNKKVPAQTRQKLCKTKNGISNGTNVFLKGNGQAYIFVTKDGKTKIL